jgi:RNA polymerase sigma factor (sigma-70 family)
MQATTDQELIRRFVVQRDERAFRELYAAHTPPVYGLLRRLAGTAVHDADDALQDAWLRAASNLHAFRHESSFRTWLTGIALNCLRECRRRSARSGDSCAAVPAEPHVSAAARSLDVDEVLGALSDAHREVLVLHDVEGYTHEEIAGALGIEVGTSKSRLSRARQVFRDRWRATPAPRGAEA